MKWPTSSLDSIAILDRQSIHPSEVDAATPYLGLEHLDGDGGIDCTQTIGSAELKSNKFQFSDRHVLFGKLRPYLRKIVRPSFSGVCSTDIIPILPKEGVSRAYLFYFLRTPDIVNLATSRCSGVNLPRLSPKQLASFRIPLPPFDEQRRIAEILDKADALRAKRRGCPRPTRHPHPIYLSRHVRGPRHESEGVAGGDHCGHMRSKGRQKTSKGGGVFLDTYSASLHKGGGPESRPR